MAKRKVTAALYRDTMYVWGVTSQDDDAHEAVVEVDPETKKRWLEADKAFMKAQQEMQQAARDQAGNGKRYGR